MSKTSKMDDENFKADLVAARKRLIWSMSEKGLTPTQIADALNKSHHTTTYVVKYALQIHPEHPSQGKSVYTELERVSREWAVLSVKLQDEHKALNIAMTELLELRDANARFSLALNETKTTIEAAKKEAMEEHEISRACIYETAKHVATSKELRDQIASVHTHNSELLDLVEKLEGKLEKYEDAEGSPIKRGRPSKSEGVVRTRLTELEDRIENLEELENELRDKVDLICEGGQ